jgi:transcriptional regulator with XRE-family HTH domain
MKKLKTGPILQSVCKELGLNNSQVAELISVTPSNVGRIFKQDNVNTDTLDRLTEKLGINIYQYLAKEWDKLVDDDPSFIMKEPQGEYFRHIPKYTKKELESNTKISLLIEIDADKQAEVMKILKL